MVPGHPVIFILIIVFDVTSPLCKIDGENPSIEPLVVVVLSLSCPQPHDFHVNFEQNVVSVGVFGGFDNFGGFDCDFFFVALRRLFFLYDVFFSLL